MRFSNWNWTNPPNLSNYSHAHITQVGIGVKFLVRVAGTLL